MKRIPRTYSTVARSLAIAIVSFVTFASFAIGFAFMADAAINREINYQGKLTDTSNVSVADGTYNMEFKLYTVSSGGSPVWTETRTSGDKVQVTSGLFSIRLGEVTSLAGVDFNQPLYLGVNIGGTSTPGWDGEMTPRKKLGSVPSAFVAETLNGLYSHEFFRNDAINSTSSSVTFFKVEQAGAGAVAEFIGTGSSTALIIKSDGTIGIGTTTPAQKLSVAGNMRLTGALFDSSNASGTSGMVLQSTGVGTQWVATSSLGISGGGSGNAAFTIGNGVIYNATSTDLVGIGTSSPSTTLFIQGKGGTNPFAIASSTGASMFSLLQNGNVGIGTSTPSAMLTVEGDVMVSTTSAYYSGNSKLAYIVDDPFGGINEYRSYFFGDAGTTTSYENSGYGNIGMGYGALSNVAGGSENIALGRAALSGLDIGSNNIAIGQTAMGNSSMGSFAIAIGTAALSNFNSPIGYAIGIGENALANNILGSESVAIGAFANANAGTSTRNTAVGTAAGVGVTASDNSNNVLFGYYAGSALTSGSNNVLLGYQAGDGMTSGSNNIVIGYDIDAPSNTGSNQMTIGNLIFGTGLTSTGATVSTGSIGIGSSTPSARLAVKGVAGSGDVFTVASSTDSRMFVVKSTGSVGIGTTTPAGKLAVTGNGTGSGIAFIVADSGNVSRFTITDAGAVTAGSVSASGGFAAGNISLTNSGLSTNITSGLVLTAAMGGGIQFVGGATEMGRFTTSGSFGIGTSSPIASLTVKGAGTTTPFVVASSTGAQMLTLLTDGNFGIGTSSPVSALAVNGTTTATAFVGRFVGDGSGITGVTASAAPAGSTGNIQYNGGGSTAGSNMLQWDSSNLRLGIGTSTPSDRLTVIGGNIAHVASGTPVLEGSISLSETRGMYAVGSYLYVTDSTSGLLIYDVSDPSAPVLLSTTDTPDTAASVFVSGRYAYVGEVGPSAGLRIYDISDPYLPVLVGSETSMYGGASIVLSGKYAYLGLSNSGLKIYDISSPSAPKYLGRYFLNDNINDIAVRGNFAYMAADGGVYVIDVTNPLSPVLASSDTPASAPLGIYVTDKNAYVADGTSGVLIYDITDRYAITEVGSYNTAGTANAVSLVGTDLYVADHSSGLAVLDVSSSTAPALTGTYDTSGNLWKLAVAGRHVYGSDYGSGISIFGIGGLKTPSIKTGSIDSSVLYVEDRIVARDAYVQNGLVLGNNGMFSEGGISVALATSTSSGVAASFLNGNVGIGTSTPAERLHVAGNILIGARSDSAGAWTKRSDTTAGTITSGGTTAVGTTTAMAVFNGSLYAGTSKPNGAEIYRYNGSTWTRVSSTTAGSIGTSTTANIDTISRMTVWNGQLYVGTAEPGAAEVYRYNGNSSWTKISSSTAGAVGGNGTTTAIDSISAMAVHGGKLYVGTTKTNTAEVYRYNGAGLIPSHTWTKVSNLPSNAGTIGSTANVDSVTVLFPYQGYLYAGTSEAGSSAALYRYDGQGVSGTGFTIVGAAGTFSGTSPAGLSTVSSVGSIRTAAVYDGKVYLGIDDGAGTARIVKWDGNLTAGGNYEVVSSTTAGIIAEDVGATAGIDRIGAMSIYNDDLYIGTVDSTGIGEVYKLDDGSTWTKISSTTAGTINTSGGTQTGSITGVFSMTVYNDDLWVGTEKASAAEVYSFNMTEGQSYNLAFEAASDDADPIQNNLANRAFIQFQAEETAFNSVGNAATGKFVFSHGINTVTGAYDLAEDYPTADDTLAPGDLVSLDTTRKGFVRKSQGKNDRDVIGIYSVDPALRLSQKDGGIDGAKAIPVALAGRVPVSVTLENGPIRIGDYLTSSMEPGKAAKASKPGRVIGRALGAYAGQEGEDASVTVFIGAESIDWNDLEDAETDASEIADESSGGADSIVEFVDLVNDRVADIAFAVLNKADNLSVIISNTLTSITASIQDLFAKNISLLPNGSISLPVGENQIAGVGTLGAGSTDVFIANDQIDSDSIIYISPTSEIDSPLYVGKKEPGKGFHVRTKYASGSEVTFDWFFVKTYRPKGNASLEIMTTVEGTSPSATSTETTVTTISTDVEQITSAGQDAASDDEDSVTSTSTSTASSDSPVTQTVEGPAVSVESDQGSDAQPVPAESEPSLPEMSEDAAGGSAAVQGSASSEPAAPAPDSGGGEQ